MNFNLIVKSILSRMSSKNIVETEDSISQSVQTIGLSPIKNNSKNGLIHSLLIPEPTRSLIWTTEEDTSKIVDASLIRITISFSEDGIKSAIEKNGFFAEPSLIWSKLSIQPNSEHETSAMYYPSYSRFSPKIRYQYLSWLRDITQPTNLSYVFLYFYGLERHLLIGDYDKAVDEIIKLVKHHSKGSFRWYASNSLVVASIAKKRMDIIERAPFLLEEETDATMALRIFNGTTMSPDDIISIASRVGFTNKRYIKLHPEIFKRELQKNIDEFEVKYGKLLSVFQIEQFRQEKVNVFANLSIPENIRMVKVPQILEDKRFQDGIKSLLVNSHENVKVYLGKKSAK